jgi:hypothetical protein
VRYPLGYLALNFPNTIFENGILGIKEKILDVISQRKILVGKADYACYS